MDDQVAIGGIYAHYNADESARSGDNYTYEVIIVATHTETDETMVVYKQLYTSEESTKVRVWTRPLSGPKGFLTPEGDVPRFRLIK